MDKQLRETSENDCLPCDEGVQFWKQINRRYSLYIEGEKNKPFVEANTYSSPAAAGYFSSATPVSVTNTATAKLKDP